MHSLECPLIVFRRMNRPLHDGPCEVIQGIVIRRRFTKFTLTGFKSEVELMGGKPDLDADLNDEIPFEI